MPNKQYSHGYIKGPRVNSSFVCFVFFRCDPQAAGSLPRGILWDHPQEADLHLHWAGARAAHLWPAHYWHRWPKGQHRISQVPVQLHPGMHKLICNIIMEIPTHFCMCVRQLNVLERDYRTQSQDSPHRLCLLVLVLVKLMWLQYMWNYFMWTTTWPLVQHKQCSTQWCMPLEKRKRVVMLAFLPMSCSF